MDLMHFKLDLDELLGDFVEVLAVLQLPMQLPFYILIFAHFIFNLLLVVQGNCMTLADMKTKWKERKCSYIFEAKPTTNSAFFMQSLYAHSLSMTVT
jgi:Small nuclear RNA activating complex (SNAPc), subunit 1